MAFAFSFPVSGKRAAFWLSCSTPKVPKSLASQAQLKFRVNKYHKSSSFLAYFFLFISLEAAWESFKRHENSNIFKRKPHENPSESGHSLQYGAIPRNDTILHAEHPIASLVIWHPLVRSSLWAQTLWRDSFCSRWASDHRVLCAERSFLNSSLTSPFRHELTQTSLRHDHELKNSQSSGNSSRVCSTHTYMHPYTYAYP